MNEFFKTLSFSGKIQKNYGRINKNLHFPPGLLTLEAERGSIPSN